MTMYNFPVCPTARSGLIASLFLAFVGCQPAPEHASTGNAAQADTSSPARGPAGFGTVEQTAQGSKPSTTLAVSFDGIGVGFHGPQGTFRGATPSDNSLAVGPDHIVQTVNRQMAIFTKKGKRFDTTGKVLYGPVNTNNVFKGFGGGCELNNSTDAVVRYEQLADRWLLVVGGENEPGMRPEQVGQWKAGDPVHLSPPGRPGQPGPAAPLVMPPSTSDSNAAAEVVQYVPPKPPYTMCYAVSSSPDPTGSWYRYEFVRPLFPDYPRPAVWPDGYYVPTSTSDDRISKDVVTEKHACVLDRSKMLRGLPATEQCILIDNVSFLN